MSSNDLDIRIIEAGPRILPALPEKISYAAKQSLQKISVNVMEGTRIASASKQGLTTAEGELIEADMMVWAAGVKAPEFIQNLGYFDCNRAGQILVNEHLQSTVDEKIFVLGDCAGLELSDGKWVPPRAQSAHQMANTVLTNIQNTLQNKPLKSFNYVDYGSLVHLSKYSTVGSLMGKLSNNNMFIEGRLARVVYKSLYSMHMLAVHGRFKGALTLMSRKVGHLIGPKFKLH